MNCKLNLFPRILGNRVTLIGSRWWRYNASMYFASLRHEPVNSSRCLGTYVQHRSIAANATRPFSKTSSRAALFDRMMELAKIYSSPSADAYKDCALFRATPQVLGTHIEKYCRSIYNNLLFPGDKEPSDAPPGLCINGSARGASSTSCDFVSGDCRVEVKVSSLQFQKKRQTWHFRWYSVKPLEFDRLILVGYTPQQVLFWEWDKATRFSKAGNSTDACGGHICISGKSKTLSWQSGLRDIEKKCPWRVLHSQDVSTMLLPGASQTEVVFRSHPLSQLKPSARGNLYAHFCKDVYSTWLFPRAQVPDEAPYGTCVNGSRRTHHNSTCDFSSGSLRVEVKSARLTWNSCKRLWNLRWSNIKPNQFDQLLLVVDAPHEISIWEWDQQSGLTADGSRTRVHGYKIALGGSVGQSCREAYASIVKRIPAKFLLEVQLPELL